MPAIIKQYGNDNNLTRLAMANPIIALERTGLTFTPEAKDEIESYVRFGKEGAKRLYDLREKISAAVGGKIDIRNPEQLADAILSKTVETDSTKQQPSVKKSAYRQNSVDRAKLLEALKARPKKVDNQWVDQLAEFASVHPVVPLLIEYRQMESERTGFTDPKDIQHVEERIRKSPFTSVVFSLQRNRDESPK